MLSYDEARKTLKYYGFISNNIEPILCKEDGKIGVFVTFKTKYGHLSRFVEIKNKKELEIFLKKFVWYRKNVDENDVIVEFDDYEKLDPNIKFIKDSKEIKLDSNNNVIEQDTEEKEIRDEKKENIELLEIINKKIKSFVDDAKKLENDVIDAISSYLDNLTEYYNFRELDSDVDDITINAFEEDDYLNKINKIINNYKEDKSESFDLVLNVAVGIYNEILLDQNYVEDLYLLEYYKNENDVVSQKIKLYKEYLSESNKKSKLIRKKKNKTFDDYVNEKIIVNTINKDKIINARNKEVGDLLYILLNSSVDELKVHYNIISTDILNIAGINSGSQSIDDIKFKSYYDSLTNKEKTINIILSSPIKELINVVYGISNEDKLHTIVNEKKYLNKFKELYEILSNEDNFATSRKYLKPIKLDTIEEFISSIINVVDKIHDSRYILPSKTILKYKIGVMLKEGYINASLEDNFPNNNKGLNNYYISETSVDIPVYYSNKILRINETDNLLEIANNKDVVTFDMKGLSVSNKDKIKVNNYLLKKNKNDNEYDDTFKLFNEKIYSTSKINESGD